MLALLIAAILSLPSTGNPTPAEARAIAEPVMRCTKLTPLDGFDLVALMRLESGFRTDVENGRMAGVLQLNTRFVPPEVDPFDPGAAISHWCEEMLPRWRIRHARCPPGHPLLAHHFGGNHPKKRAIAAAERVLRLGRKLREHATPRS